MSQSLRNLITPFRRDRKHDFASDDSTELLKSRVLQALMTRGTTPRSSGELPWRTNFGAGLELLRHQRNDDVLSELAAVYVKDALKKWVPEVVVTRVDVNRKDVNLLLKVKFTMNGNSKGSNRKVTIVDVSITVSEIQ